MRMCLFFTPPDALFAPSSLLFTTNVHDPRIRFPRCQHPVPGCVPWLVRLPPAVPNALAPCVLHLCASVRFSKPSRSLRVGVILLIVVLSWLKSATSLAEQFNALAENDEELKAELA